VVRRLICDSLRYWVQEMHVDGFRFDLASVLTRDEHGAALPKTRPEASAFHLEQTRTHPDARGNELGRRENERPYGNVLRRRNSSREATDCVRISARMAARRTGSSPGFCSAA
jgi:hypothetical protein